MLILDQLRKSDRSLRVLAILVLVGMFTLLAGLWYVQVLSAPRFQNELQNQSYRTVRVPAIRGKVLDRHGVALAENRPGYAINLYLDELREQFKEEYKRSKPARALTRQEATDLGRLSRFRVASGIVERIGTALGAPLGLDATQFHRHYERKLALPMPVLENLNPEQVARFVEKCSTVPGVSLEIQPARFYPLKGASSHVVGYLQRNETTEDEEDVAYHYRLPDFKGATGIEAMFDRELRGRAGVRSMLVNNYGYRQSESMVTAPEPGDNVTLTFDSRIQSAAESALQAVGRDTRGSAVVMDCRTGDLLAMVSSPSVDPNEFFPHPSPEEWKRAMDPKLRPLFNRGTHGGYPPGSIFKIITGLACLESGVMAASDVMTNTGIFWVGRRPIKDTAAPGLYDFVRAFRRSSNSYFIYFGLKARIESILDVGHQFFLGEKTGVLPLQEVGGDFPKLEEIVGHWSAGDTANLCIGQGPITVTPVQMAVLTSAVANGGKVFWPRLVEKVSPAEPGAGDVSYTSAGRIRGQLKVSAPHLEIVRKAMRADVEETDGTGHPADVPGMQVCGKTGTAQITRGHIVVDHITWFVSFAPLDEPRYAVVVVVESGASGGGTCAPVAGKIYKTIQKIEQGGGRQSGAVAMTRNDV